MNNWKLHQYARITTVFCVVLLLLLFGFQSIWVAGGSASSIMEQTGLQRTRMQLIAKDVLILENRPVAERPQAINELQIVAPLFEKTQKGLVQGDPTLKLPTSIPGDIEQLVLFSQSDFTAIDAALHVVLTYPDAPIDPIQVTVILSHEHTYTQELSQVNTAWKTKIDNAFLHLYWIESGIVFVLEALLVIIFVLRQLEHKQQ